ncbi:GNAT family N-acetyltransferase [Boudabousia liubingyangii]|uniref:GNAT family N-acetyltransferase n=1 Tax=Boudabousia liubingyangii TaxID=1921764 RepID=UPI000A9EAEED|nr:GNAT family N-acetyltransferase [Boudabousia liubingyangii]
MPLFLRTPTREEFPVRQAWLADPQMMSFNAGWPIDNDSYDPETGCFDWSEDRWDAWVERRLSLPPEVQGYFYVIDQESGEPVGHAHYLVEGTCAQIGLNTVPKLRRQGIATEAMTLLLERIWQDTEAEFAMNMIEQAQAPAICLHKKFGFLCSSEPAMTYQEKRSYLWLLARPTTDSEVAARRQRELERLLQSPKRLTA